MALSLRDFMNVQLLIDIPKPTTLFTGKTVIITGASSGLGKEAAKHLVANNAAKVILACRSTYRGNATKLEIESQLKCNKDLLEVWELELEDTESVKTFAKKANELERVDVLINNAGIPAAEFEVVNGTERSIAVNVIGTFSLSILLLPKLRETGDRFGSTPHLTCVSSALYSTAKYPEGYEEDVFAWLGEKKNVDVRNQYNLSKLFQILIIRKLASIIDPLSSPKSAFSSNSKIVINSLDPCYCKTALFRSITGGLKIFMHVFQFLFARTAEEGARTVVIAASAGRDLHGGYMRAGVPKVYAPMLLTKDMDEKAELLWEQLGKRLELINPGILGNLKC